jgi:ABC-type nitrate/sulfonate/bicarbonate transport system ATPase subunit
VLLDALTSWNLQDEISHSGKDKRTALLITNDVEGIYMADRIIL